MWNINLLHCVQTAPGAHPDFYQVGTGGIPGGSRGSMKVTLGQQRPWLAARWASLPNLRKLRYI